MRWIITDTAMKQIHQGLALILLFLLTAAGQPDGRVAFVEHEDRIDVLIDGSPVTSYRFSCEGLKPCLWPVRTRDGVIVTRGYPLQEVEGENTDHRHHAGVYFTFERVNGNNFWNFHEPPPEIRHVEVLEMDGGDGEGTLSVLKHWIGEDGETLLEEEQTMRFVPDGDQYAVDFTMTLTATGEEVVFEDTKEGMFAIRVANWLTEEPGTGEYLSSNGERTEENVWGRRAEWMRLEGEKAGRQRGVALMNHPTSTNYPTYWHARGYGLFSANPLGQFTFQEAHDVPNPEPFQLTLGPGESAPFRFKMLVYDGARTSRHLDRAFEAYGGE